jgi:hypothetical protein
MATTMEDVRINSYDWNKLDEAGREQLCRRVHENQHPGLMELREVRPGVFVGKRAAAPPSTPQGEGSPPPDPLSG